MPETVVITGPADTVTVGVPVTQVVEVGYAQPGGGGSAGFSQDFTGLSQVTVTHNLGRRPAVTVTDTAGDVVHGDITYLSLNAVRLAFSAPFGGTVICT